MTTNAVLSVVLLIATVSKTNAGSKPPPKPKPSKCATNHRHRKAWQEISDDERQLYIDGFKELAARDITKEFTLTHIDSSEHQNAAFLPWHREFVWLMETAIRSLGGKYACFAMPYWDWTREPTPKEVGHNGLELFITHSGLGGDSDGWCLMDDVWGSDHYDPLWHDCLIRDLDYADSKFGCTFWTAAQLMSLIDSTQQYQEFRPYLEGTPHALPHVCIGGTHYAHMGTHFSPDDPIFWLHHSFLDLTWALWQYCNDYDGSDASSGSAEYFGDINAQLKFSKIVLGTVLGDDFVSPRVFETFDIVNDLDVSFEKGMFWHNAGVDKANNCRRNGVDDVDTEWFYEEEPVDVEGEIDAEMAYDVSSVIEECKAIEGRVESRGVICCELVQIKAFGGICEKPTVTADLTVHPQTGNPWPRHPETGDIVISLEEMTDASYALPGCCEARRRAMYAWALEFHALEDLLNGCYDPYCKLDDIGTPGYACFNRADGKDEAQAQLTQMLTTISQISISVKDLVLLVLAAFAVMMVKDRLGRAQDKTLS